MLLLEEEEGDSQTVRRSPLYAEEHSSDGYSLQNDARHWKRIRGQHLNSPIRRGLRLEDDQKMFHARHSLFLHMDVSLLG